MSKRSLITLSTCALAFVFATGFRGGCGARSPEDKVRHLERGSERATDHFLDDLDADDAQRAEIQAQVRALVPEATAMILAHAEVKASLQAEWKKEKPDREALHGIVDTQVGRLSALLHRLVDAGVGIHETLTPEQRAEVSERWE